MKLVAIVAMTPDRIIGRDGGLPWHLPEDLAFFKRTTSGHPILMGRKTYESIGRPLPKRRNIVITRDKDWTMEGVDVIHTPEGLQRLGIDDTVFVIGGSEVYQLFLEQLDELIVSHIFSAHSGDTRFPAFEHHFQPPETIATFDDFEVKRYIAT